MPHLHYVEEPIQVSFDSKGKLFSLERFGFSIEVPPFAVPVGEEVILEVGICCYGPFSIGKNHLLASDFIVIVTVAGSSFSRPINITMEHCLILPKYKKCNEVTILRADHRHTEQGWYNFKPYVHPEILSDSPSLSFKTKDLCILCAALGHVDRDRSSSASSASSITNFLNKAHLDDDNPSSSPSSFDEDSYSLGIDRSFSTESCPPFSRSFSAESHQQIFRMSSDGGQSGYDEKENDNSCDTSPQKMPRYEKSRSLERGTADLSRQAKLSRQIKRSKRSRDSTCSDSLPEKKYHRYSVEYAALLFEHAERNFQALNVVSHFAIFVCLNCPGAIQVSFSVTNSTELVSLMIEITIVCITL